MQSRSDGQCMCLTAHNAYLWLQGFGEVAKYERFISGAERAKLQGMDVEVSGRVKSTQSCQVRVFGNAMAVPLIRGCHGVLLERAQAARNRVM